MRNPLQAVVEAQERHIAQLEMTIDTLNAALHRATQPQVMAFGPDRLPQPYAEHEEDELAAHLAGGSFDPNDPEVKAILAAAGAAPHLQVVE